jgi:hypothetical protein
VWKTLTAIRLEHGGDLFSARAVDDFVVEDEIRNFWLSGMFYDFDESMWMGRRKKKVRVKIMKQFSLFGKALAVKT